MAIDTEDKRRSTLGLLAGPRVLPVPGGAIDAQDRAHLWLYRGIAVGNIVGGPYWVAELEVHRPGSVAIEVHVPGAAAAQVHVPGPVAVEGRS